MSIIEKLAKEFQLKLSQVENTVQLIDDGNTIPFIARYRKRRPARCPTWSSGNCTSAWSICGIWNSARKKLSASSRSRKS